MPRDASGNYTLPPGNPVSAGTVIESAWANTTMDDLKAEMTNSLDRAGRGGMTGPLRIVAGTAPAPGLAFREETGTGLWRSAAGVIDIVTLGASRVQVKEGLVVGAPTDGDKGPGSGNFESLFVDGQAVEGGITLSSWGEAWIQLADSLAGRVELDTPRLTVETRAPLVSDDESEGYRVGDFWVDVATGFVYLMSDKTTDAAVWPRLETYLSLLQGYDYNFAFTQGTPFAAGTSIGPNLTTVRSWVLPQNLVGSRGSLSHGAHTAVIAFDLFAYRVEWGGSPVKLCRVDFGIGSQSAVFSELHPDVVAGDVTFQQGSILYLVDTYGSIRNNMISDQNGDVTLKAEVL